MNTYRCSNGERVTQLEIDKNIRQAKKQLIQNCIDEHNYVFCQTCKRNDCVPVDCAHIISLKEAKETGRTELCWQLSNYILEGRNCHKKRDGLDLKFNN